MIRSTFAGFTTGQLALAASQRALDVTGQNIANINTEGYTRQRLDIASLNTQKGDFYNSNSTIKVGFGVEMTGISQLRDPFLDAQYRSQICKLGTTDAHAAGFEQLTPIFDETTMDGVRAALREITSSLSTLSNQVGNEEFDTMVRSNMQILLNLFRDNAVRLQDVRDDMQYGFETTDVADLNEIMQNIAELNTSIKNSQILGNPALELQDQRNLLLDELASYIPITVNYRDVEIGPGTYVEVLDVNFTDTNGMKYTLITDGRYGSFEADISGQPVTLALNDANGTYGIDVTNVLGSGTIKGTLDFLNKSGDFDNTDFKGLGYYEYSLNALVNTFAQVMNEANQAVEIDAAGNVTPVDRPLFETTDGSATFTASNIKIADGWTNGTYRITNSTVVVDGKIGSTANESILNMINLLESDQEFLGGPNGATKFFTGSFYDCFANIESTLGVETKSSQTMLENQIAVLNQTSNSRDGVSGVQLDEEGMNLLHYNQSYTAASRYITTLDEALDTLINRTGVVGR